MSLECTIGPERNLLEDYPNTAERVRLPHPVLSNDELAAMAGADHAGF